MSIQQEQTTERRGVLVSPVIWNAFVLILAALIGYFSAYSALNARVAVLEAQFVTLHGDIQEIKIDVKTLLERGR